MLSHPVNLDSTICPDEPIARRESRSLGGIYSMRRKLFTAISCFLLMSISCPELKAQTNVDDVFIDEGDGDFDAYSIVPEHLSSSVPEVKSKPAETESVVPEAPKPAPVKHAVAAEPKKTPKKSAQIVEKKSRKPASAPKPRQKPSGAGIYVRTKEACPMLRQPASESPTMLTVKASRKLWVEEVNEDWVRAYNKAGEPGYIQRDCLE